MQQAADKPLSPHYYRDNFLSLCDTVEDRYSDILNDEESAFLIAYRRLPFNAQCLYVRLASRVGPWFRETTLSYGEIEDLPAALEILLQCELMVEAQALTTDDLHQLYTKAELQQMFAGALGSDGFARKDDLLDAIDRVLAECEELPDEFHVFERGRIIAPTAADIVEKLQILFFGNRHQSLTEFILEDLGHTRYYPYSLDREQRYFSCRDAFEEYLACATLSDLYREVIEEGDLPRLPDLAAQIATVDVRFPSSRRRFSRLCNAMARDLERLGQESLALELYTKSDRHPSRERRARVLEKQEQWAKAQSLCAEILDNPWCEAEAEAARRILPRVLRKLGSKPAPRPRDRFNERQISLADTGEAVELLTARYLEKEGTSVHYVENSLMNALFGLAFWEQIFMSVPGAFHHAYQGVPADMYEAGFREARAQALEQRLGALAGGKLKEQIVDAWHRYHGYQCHWTNWRYLQEEQIVHALSVIPQAHLLAILQRMLFDPRENRKGFPDLLALGETAGDYCMIEVKGPGDALQDSQKRWLRFFQAHDIPAQVAWVSFTDE